MNIRKILLVWVTCIACAAAGLNPALATESDIGKEKRWAQQVIDGLLDGGPEWLDDGTGHKFLAVLTEGDTGSGRAVILVHGIGVHPNWPDVIYPLRSGLLEQEITSLSIQMPILANEAEDADYGKLFAEVPGRMQAAIGFLRDAGYEQIAIVAHSMGAAMTSYFLSNSGDHGLRTTVLIGMGASNAWPGNIEALGRITMPVLDLYGSEDLESVLFSASDRAASGARVDGYLQKEVAGANHFFQGHEEALVSEVLQWLENHWAGGS